MGTVENWDIKQQIVPTRKATKIQAQKAKTNTKRNRVLEETIKERDIGICQKSSVLFVVNMDILHEIVGKHEIMLILLQKVEQNKKVENMLDLDNISVSEEFEMMCTEVQYEDEDIVEYVSKGLAQKSTKKLCMVN